MSTVKLQLKADLSFWQCQFANMVVTGLLEFMEQIGFRRGKICKVEK